MNEWEVGKKICKEIKWKRKQNKNKPSLPKLQQKIQQERDEKKK